MAKKKPKKTSTSKPMTGKSLERKKARFARDWQRQKENIDRRNNKG